MTRSRGPVIPASPFSPIVPLFLSPADSDLYDFLKEAHAIIQQAPNLVKAVDKDLDAHGLRKKAVRVADAKWLEKQASTLPGMPDIAPDPDKPLVLMDGRPRTPSYVVLIALLLRGYSGAGFKSADTTSAMVESITLRVFFTNLDLKMPSRSTLTELVNAVSNETRLLVLDAQLAWALHLKLDDFKTLLQDSTHVGGNTVWPTDSLLMVDLVSRLIHISKGFDRIHLPPIECDGISKFLSKMVSLNREIDFSRGKKGSKRTRRRRYEKLLRMAKRIYTLLDPQVAKLAEAMVQIQGIHPSPRYARVPLL